MCTFLSIFCSCIYTRTLCKNISMMVLIYNDSIYIYVYYMQYFLHHLFLHVFARFDHQTWVAKWHAFEAPPEEPAPPGDLPSAKIPRDAQNEVGPSDLSCIFTC